MAPKDEQVGAKWIVPKDMLDLARQAVEAAPHVGRSGREPHARAERR